MRVVTGNESPEQNIARFLANLEKELRHHFIDGPLRSGIVTAATPNVVKHYLEGV